MREDAATSSVHFEPLHPASRATLIVGVVVGPLLWLVAISLAALLLDDPWAIALGLVVAGGSFLVALVSLALLRSARVRQEERYVDGG